MYGCHCEPLACHSERSEESYLSLGVNSVKNLSLKYKTLCGVYTERGECAQGDIPIH